jgi:hypothetical protein
MSGTTEGCRILPSGTSSLMGDTGSIAHAEIKS